MGAVTRVDHGDPTAARAGPVHVERSVLGGVPRGQGAGRRNAGPSGYREFRCTRAPRAGRPDRRCRRARSGQVDDGSRRAPPAARSSVVAAARSRRTGPRRRPPGQAEHDAGREPRPLLTSPVPRDGSRAAACPSAVRRYVAVAWSMVTANEPSVGPFTENQGRCGSLEERRGHRARARDATGRPPRRGRAGDAEHRLERSSGGPIGLTSAALSGSLAVFLTGWPSRGPTPSARPTSTTGAEAECRRQRRRGNGAAPAVVGRAVPRVGAGLEIGSHPKTSSRRSPDEE
jgi:hypothetical protein